MINNNFIEHVKKADAEVYPDRYLFEPVKRHILTTYGRPEGYDLQILKESCDYCKGSGLVLSRFTTQKIPCNDCKGIGDSRKFIYLKRYYLQDQLFRLETTKAEAKIKGEKAKSVIIGKIKIGSYNKLECISSNIILAGVFKEIEFEGTPVFEQLTQTALSAYYNKLYTNELVEEIKNTSAVLFNKKIELQRAV